MSVGTTQIDEIKSFLKQHFCHQLHLGLDFLLCFSFSAWSNVKALILPRHTEESLNVEQEVINRCDETKLKKGQVRSFRWE